MADDDEDVEAWLDSLDPADLKHRSPAGRLPAIRERHMTVDASRYIIGPDATIGDVDLDETEIYVKANV